MLGTKTITVVVSGSGKQCEVEVTPQTEVRDILEQLNLKEYNLSQGRNAQPMGEKQLPFIFAEDGGKLYATPKGMTVGK